MKPFLKWAGNKYQILSHILPELPAGTRLIEPFVGSGAVFLNTSYSQYLLADSNADLISLYSFLQEEGEEFIDYCSSFFTPQYNTEEMFYECRQRFNEKSKKNRRRTAALFLYLNKHGFNGLCRYNAKGGFNVPFGRYTKPYFPREEMRFFSKHAQSATFCHADFLATMDEARTGDIVYCDPPYVPLSETANFTGYQAEGFTRKHQEMLRDKAEELAVRGVFVMISNHDTDFTRNLYTGSTLFAFMVQRFISCDGTNRHKAPELLAVYDGH